MTLTHFDRVSLVAMPWKDGGGVTREIARSPRNSTMATFAWRASIAEVSGSGPFSVFPGIDRALILLTGRGVHLHSDDGTVDHALDQAFDPFLFSGDTPITATLFGGRCTDFNVMTRRNHMRAQVQVIRSAQAIVASSSGVLLAVRGDWTATFGSGSESIRADGGVWWDDEEIEWRLVPASADAALIAVRMWRVGQDGV